jgi:hypothetical protein
MITFFASTLFTQVILSLSFQQPVAAILLLTVYSCLINTSAQLLLTVSPNLYSCWICTRSTEKACTSTQVEWPNVKLYTRAQPA